MKKYALTLIAVFTGIGCSPVSKELEESLINYDIPESARYYLMETNVDKYLELLKADLLDRVTDIGEDAYDRSYNEYMDDLGALSLFDLGCLATYKKPNLDEWAGAVDSNLELFHNKITDMVQNTLPGFYNSGTDLENILNDVSILICGLPSKIVRLDNGMAESLANTVLNKLFDSQDFPKVYDVTKYNKRTLPSTIVSKIPKNQISEYWEVTMTNKMKYAVVFDQSGGVVDMSLIYVPENVTFL